ncbi:MAG: HAD-IA family hydrolase [Albidovulum sp.]
MARPGYELIAWDFDGVLNCNIKDGEFLWHRSFEADLGASATQFAAFMFRSGRFHDVLIGQRDVLDLLAQWIAEYGVGHSPQQVLDYWLAKDAHADQEVLSWVQACNIRSVIATNNEFRRAAYIWGPMGFGAHMAKMFAAGPMGVRKPDAAFFRQIEDWSGLPPDKILLVDDAEANIAAAHKCGWNAFLFTDAARHRLPLLLGIEE